jgi:membrane-bound serine protease (ClpP class)
LVLLIFELFTGGVGIAGGVGALCLVLGSYGLAVLPTNPVGVALLIISVFAFAIDVQTGVPRFWTGVGVVCFAVGSVLLYTDGVSLGWLPLVAGMVGVLLLVLGGLPATVRSRFSTPTIGRESMVGESGQVVADVKPDGVVSVRGALWPAHTSRVTPVSAGQTVRVVGIDGPRLVVEPSEE